MLPVLHGTAKAISVSEFLEALYAISPPRFPFVRRTRHRSVGMFYLFALIPLCSLPDLMCGYLQASPSAAELTPWP
jgi:hypothetical protein